MNLRSAEEYIPLTPHALQVLLALASGPKHGYAIMLQTHDDSSGSVAVGRGSLYRTLKSLEQWNLIEKRVEMPAWGPGKPSKWCGLTDTGRTVLEWEVERARMIVHLGYERLRKPKKELESSFFKGFAAN
jgi:DNA-binding PadR family transcriptional regulator